MGLDPWPDVLLGRVAAADGACCCSEPGSEVGRRDQVAGPQEGHGLLGANGQDFTRDDAAGGAGGQMPGVVRGLLHLAGGRVAGPHVLVSQRPAEVALRGNEVGVGCLVEVVRSSGGPAARLTHRSWPRARAARVLSMSISSLVAVVSMKSTTVAQEGTQVPDAARLRVAFDSGGTPFVLLAICACRNGTVHGLVWASHAGASVARIAEVGARGPGKPAFGTAPPGGPGPVRHGQDTGSYATACRQSFLSPSFSM
ncbi:hypothetical protein KE639_07342 [Streptomyces sp. V17-9]|nr:hypothetical protein KE639_00011 [Streptomyces sp. V17-9]QUW96072.1 hypothetical protein KE639_07342 [Streptomyces sp. V17-9]